jgi:pyruvate-formate lyase-activating enzyme
MKPDNPASQAEAMLSSIDHRRDSAGMVYVYPVVSRRAGGVSVGINLNPNNACNWHCVYCQVPDLVRGAAPVIDLALLETELRALLTDLLQGDFMHRRVPEEARRIMDVAFSGNGEPTSAREFAEAVDRVGRLMAEFGLTVPLRLITNGSLVDQPRVREGIARLARWQGEVWFKLDAGSRAGITRINGVDLAPEQVVRRLVASAQLCPTWVQSCFFVMDGCLPEPTEVDAWLACISAAHEQAARQSTPASAPGLAGVLLYGLARPSMQPEAGRLAPLPVEWLENLAQRVRQLGLRVRVSP